MKFKRIFLVTICFLLSFVFLTTSDVQAKDLVYEAHIGKNGEGQSYLTFRKYVRHYGESSDSNWNYPNKLLSSQVSNAKGSYVTNAMIFHKDYGTNYVWWEDNNTVIDVGYDINSKRIDTDETYEGDNGTEDAFFNYYGISSKNTWIKLNQNSNRWGTMGEYLEEDLIVSKERILNNIAITDFKAEGDTYKEIINSVKENIKKDGNWYKTMVSGNIKVKSYESGTKWDISTAQEMLDVMVPESTQAYNNGVGNTINSYWTGNDFGYTEKGTSRKLKTGYSVLNNFDNWLWIADPGDDDSSKKEIYVNHFDSLGNHLWWAENPTQELQDKNGNKITDIRNDTLDKKLPNETVHEAYEINENQKLKVKNSDVIENKTYEYGDYSYTGYEKISYNKNSNGDWELDSSKTSYGNASDTSYTVGSNDSKITTIDFYYQNTGGGSGESSKTRKIYVNHLSTDGTKLTELANSSQILYPDYTSIPNTKGIYNAEGYMEYYQIPTNKYMILKPSSKLDSSNRVQINGKWYKYVYYNTCAGSTLDEAYGSSSKLTNQKGSQFQIKHTEPVTVVTFYYTPVDGTEDDGNGINIQGKLQFKSDYNLSSNNSEFVPVNNYLYPYISGAQKYILPNVHEDSKKTTVKSDIIDEKSKSYWDDYEEYRAVTVTGDSKGGDTAPEDDENKEYNEYRYANEYTASSTTSSGNQPLKVYVGSSKNTLNIAGKSITLADYAKTEGVEQTITVSGKEKGIVEYTTTYTLIERKVVGDGEDASVVYTYSYVTSHTDPFSKKTISTAPRQSYGSSVPETDYDYKVEDVPVTYTVTLRKKWKLSHLYVYVIEDKTPEVTVNNGSNTGDSRGGVYSNGDSGIKLQLSNTYLETVKAKLKTYYQDYNDTRRKIKSAIQEKLLTSDSDFKSSDSDFKSRYLVGSDKYNGIRNAIATIQYKYYDLATNSNSGSSKLNHIYNNTDKTNGNERINIYTPLQLVEPEIKSSGEIVNQTGDTKYNSSIQRNVKFTFTPKVGSYSYGKKSVNTNDYLSEYYVKFDFNIEDVSPKYYYLDENGNRKKISGKVEAGTYIIIPKGGSITAIAKDTDVGQTSNKIRVFASTINKISNNFVDNEVFRTGKYFYGINTDNIYMDINKITQRGSTNLASENITYNGNTSSMHLDARYITYKDASTSNIGRIYDFRVTDCTDIGFKNVFRNTNKDNDNKINQTNETSYFYSGTMHWTSGINVLLNRSEDSSILPLGPYKNSKDTTYIYAPKLGYRISYDVKTTGYLNNDTKFVRITPSYYYISKDGTTYLSDNDITLYYKTSSGNYKKFKDSGYSIQFKPNDGYRALEYDNKDNLSLKYCNLNISKQFKLLNKSMITISDDEYVQCWYGEFKLPNSTIAVKNNGGSINSPLTDGYIGVKFKIEAVEKDDAGNERILSYNNSDAGIDENNNSNKGINSTQWDYEGYLGYNYNIKRGSQISSGDVNNLQLEKDTWKISNQTEYEKVKGTVILYDIDNRAANDFE